MGHGEREVLAVDFRSAVRGPQVALSTRPERISGATIVLLDNGKLSPPHVNFTAITDVLRAHLLAHLDDVTVAAVHVDLLKADLADARRIANEIARSGAGFVIIGLLDQGVTQPSIVVATELEGRGIPTSSICQGAGIRLATEMGTLLAPGLPVSLLEVSRESSYDDVAEAMRRLAPQVVAGLQAAEAGASTGIGAPIGSQTESAGIATGESPAMLRLLLEDPSGVYTRIMADSGIGDGLPLVAPTVGRIEEMLAAAKLPADAEVWPPIPPRSEPVTASDVAAVASAAGCTPALFPVVLAAYIAMADPTFRLHQAVITTHPGGTLVLVSGPLAAPLGIAGGPGCLGPGFSANATIGRAVALAGPILLGARAGGASLCVQGSPAQFTYCCSENLAESPWGSHAAANFSTDTTTVTVVKCEAPQTVLDDLSTTAASLLGTVAQAISSPASNNAYRPSSPVVVFLNPAHADLIAGEGWTREDVQRYLFEIARLDPEVLRGRGGHPLYPLWFAGLARLPAVERAEDFLVAVAGDRGPHSAVARPWPVSRGVTVAVDGFLPGMQ